MFFNNMEVHVFFKAEHRWSVTEPGEYLQQDQVLIIYVELERRMAEDSGFKRKANVFNEPVLALLDEGGHKPERCC